MHAHEIARQNWRATLDELSRLHEGALVSIEIESPDMGKHPEVVELPLVGLSSDDDDARTIAIAMARGTGTHVTHLINRPVRLFMAGGDDYADTGLEIESADRTKTTVRFMKHSVLVH